MLRLPAVSLVVATLVACGPAVARADANGDAPPTSGPPGVLGAIAVPVDALAEAVGLPVPAARATLGVDVIRRVHSPVAADGPAAAPGQRLRAIEAAFARADARTAPIPLPFPEDVWVRALFNRRAPPGGLARAIFTTPKAAFVYHGGLGLDDATRAWFAERPYRLLRVAFSDAPAFAAFGPSLRIEGTRVATPGGAAGDKAWEDLVGAKPTDPDAFVPRLFAKAEGRVAWLYDALTRLDAGQQRHLLTGEDASKRLRRLADVFTRLSPEWRLADRPFWRPRVDPAALLLGIPASADGVPAVPLTSAAWSRTLGSDEQIDVAWLAARVFLDDVGRQRERFELVLYATRWQQATGSSPAAATLALFDRAPVLALTLERLGVRDDALAARLLAFINGPVPKREAPALRTLQAGLALIERAALVGTIDAAAAGRLATGLIDGLEADGVGRGAAAWLRGPFAAAGAALMKGPVEFETKVVAALAGPSPVVPPAIEWEGQRYAVDRAAAERDRVQRIRALQDGAGLMSDEPATLAAALVALVYASALPTADPELLASRADARHDFSEGGRSATGTDPMWQIAEPVSATGVPWHLAGSVLAIDVGFAVPALRRISDDPPSPVLPPADRVGFARTAALVRADALTEASMAAVVRLVAEGRRRLAGLAGHPAEALKAGATMGLSTWRTQALGWAAANDPGALAGAVSATEAAWLAEPGAPDRVALDAWGTAGVTGRLATMFPPAHPWEDVVANDARGGLAASVADLNLRLAAFLAARHLPAALAKDLLSVATLELVDKVAARRPDDWRAVVDHAAAIADTRIEDYVAALTADGPLRPVREPEGSR